MNPKPERLHTGLALFDLARSVIGGDRSNPVEIVKALADLGLSLVSEEDFAKYLTDAARRRAELAVEILQVEKLGPR